MFALLLHRTIPNRDELMNDQNKNFKIILFHPLLKNQLSKRDPKHSLIVGMTRALKKKVSIISYHGALYFFNGRYYEYLDTDRLLMLYREYVDYDLNHESSLYGHKDLYQCCATDPEYPARGAER